MSTKICTKCLIEKTLNNFHNEKVKKDGKKNVCKMCIDITRKIHYAKNRDEILKKAKEYAIKNYEKKKIRRKNNPDKLDPIKANARSRRWEVANKDKKRAHYAVRRAIKSGKLTKKPCTVCGRYDDVEAHHEDYSKKLDVLWLCPQHHKDVHMD